MYEVYKNCVLKIRNINTRKIINEVGRSKFQELQCTMQLALNGLKTGVIQHSRTFNMWACRFFFSKYFQFIIICYSLQK
jgi:hypothetical protein